MTTPADNIQNLINEAHDATSILEDCVTRAENGDLGDFGRLIVAPSSLSESVDRISAAIDAVQNDLENHVFVPVEVINQVLATLDVHVNAQREAAMKHWTHMHNPSPYGGDLAYMVDHANAATAHLTTLIDRLKTILVSRCEYTHAHD